MLTTQQNKIVSWSFRTEEKACDGARLYAKVTAPGGSVKTVPAFLAGDGRMHVRYASNEQGIHAYTMAWEDQSERWPAGETDRIEVVPYLGDNPLYLHGRIRRAEGKRYLEHTDRTPFFYLADTWWMGFTKRIHFPDEFVALTADRVEKGFNVVQIVAGLYPDMDAFDERGMNDAGFAWNKDFTEINAAYFDDAEQRLFHLIEQGITPCIVGSWGYYCNMAPPEAIRRHWDHLIARWSAYPVIWCIAGEATMPYYLTSPGAPQVEDMRGYWTQMGHYIKENDPFDNLMTVHPTQRGHEQVDDESLLGFNMLQTGHRGPFSLLNSIQEVQECLPLNNLPILIAEACYEGICGSSGADTQRYLLLASVLTGCCGFGYGAQGLWQMSAKHEPYGVSPHGASWGDGYWDDVYKLLGSTHVGYIKRFFERFTWWDFEPNMAWIENPCSYTAIDGSYAAGIPGKVRFIYLPLFGLDFGGNALVKDIEPGITYFAYYYDPIHDDVLDLGEVFPDENGCWTSPKTIAYHDWVLVLSVDKLQ